MEIDQTIQRLMREHRVGGTTLRRYRAGEDSERVREIVGQIWGGGGPALAEQRYGMLGGKPWQEWTSRAVLSDLAAPGCQSFVAELDGVVVGFCSYTLEREKNRGVVGYNGVANEHQGKGLGSAMIGFVMACLRAEGMQFAGVIVADNEEHAPARRIYEKHGFAKLAGNYYMMQKL